MMNKPSFRTTQDVAPIENPPTRRRSKRLCWIITGVVTFLLLAIALGVGLGVGLTRDNGDDDDSDNSDSSSGNNNGTNLSPNTTVTNRALWQPSVNSTWQIILYSPLIIEMNATSTTPDVEVWDIDLFTNSVQTFQTLHSLGKKIICYFSAGSYEKFRPDSSLFQASDMGKVLDGWPGEKWLQLSSPNVRSIMAARIKLASDKGCDAIDPDNVDGYSNDNGLGLTEADSINYMQFLSAEAAKYNMSTGLKNAGAIIPDVLNVTSFSVNEQCVQYQECETFAPFINAAKPVFNIEYPEGAGKSINSAKVTDICSRTGDSEGADGFSSVMKDMNLDGWVEYCDGSVYITPTNTSGNASLM